MIVRDGLVKITDFGIARMRTTEVKTMTGMIMGSPKYMSPEQVAGKRADHRCDLFSLGVVLYEALTGEAPFQGESLHNIMYQILNSTPPAPSERNPDLPPIVDLVVAKALAKDPEQRYQSAKEMIDDLRECALEAQRRSSTQPLRNGDQPAPQAPGAAHRHDKIFAIRAAGGKTAAPETGKPAHALSKAFDSYEATLRLAAMTDAQNEVAQMARPLAGELDDAAPPLRPAAQQPAPARKARSAHKQNAWIWALTVAATAIAALLVFLARR
jgi:serine/threonine-protein kinase